MIIKQFKIFNGFSGDNFKGEIFLLTTPYIYRSIKLNKMEIIINYNNIDPVLYPNAEPRGDKAIVLYQSMGNPNSPLFCTPEEGIKWFRGLSNKDQHNHICFYSDTQDGEDTPHFMLHEHIVSTCVFNLDHMPEYEVQYGEVLSTDEAYSWELKLKY